MGTDTKRNFEETTVTSEKLFQGKVISLHLETVRLPNGETASREIVRHPGAVCVLALLDGKMLVVDQYRKALGRHQVEIPAGKLEPGEDPEEAAKRELEEETGYKCGTMTHISSYYTSPGFADELLHFYLAEDLEPGTMKLDEDEFLECEAITLEQAQEYIARSRISDAKTLMAVYVWQLRQMGNL